MKERYKEKRERGSERESEREKHTNEMKRRGGESFKLRERAPTQV